MRSNGAGRSDIQPTAKFASAISASTFSDEPFAPWSCAAWSANLSTVKKPQLNFLQDGENHAAAASILHSAGFRRLASTTFLGILSPRFAGLQGHPLSRWKPTRFTSDGSRADHSVGVAELIFRVVTRLEMSSMTRRYAVAWALSHDISTWPLSHTGEAAFSSILRLDARELRSMMIRGDVAVPERFRLRQAMEDGGIDIEVLLALFNSSEDPFDGDLRVLHSLLHSPITPDSLEGIYRSAVSIGFKAPSPVDVADTISSDLFDKAVVRGDIGAKIIEFWAAKGRVYRSYINSPRAVRFESRWSDALRAASRSATLEETLVAQERDLVGRVIAMGLAPFRGLNRYKPPLKYQLGHQIRRNRTYPVRDLSMVLTKRSLYDS